MHVAFEREGWRETEGRGRGRQLACGLREGRLEGEKRQRAGQTASM